MRQGRCGLELHRDEVLLVQLYLVELMDAEPPTLLPGVIRAAIHAVTKGTSYHPLQNKFATRHQKVKVRSCSITETLVLRGNLENKDQK